MIHFITYGNHKYMRQKTALSQKAELSGWFDKVEALGPSDLDEEFTERFTDILSREKGGGLWIWKPYIITQKLQQIKEGDVLVYLDAGCDLNLAGRKRFTEYIDIIKHSEKGILSFELYTRWKSNIPLLETSWNNQFLFDYLGISSNNMIIHSPQLVGGIMIMKKCENVMKIFDTTIDILHQKPEFFVNCKRNDQSILSVVRKMMGTELLPDETYFKENTESHPLGLE